MLRAVRALLFFSGAPAAALNRADIDPQILVHHGHTPETGTPESHASWLNRVKVRFWQIMPLRALP